MTTVRRQNIFNTGFACIKFAIFWLLILIQMPIIILLPMGDLSRKYMRIFMRIVLWSGGVKLVVRGDLDSRRPLLVVGNHISIFEVPAFPVAFGAGMMGKKEMERWPIVGTVSKKFGVVFIDRRPSHAADALALVQKNVEAAGHPMVFFPEGTTSNGAYVKEFKSTLFNFVEGSDITVQPIVVNYRFKNGDVISDADMANHFAYFDNTKQTQGPRCVRERSAFSQLFHVMVLGGFMIEMNVLPAPDLSGKTRKEMAVILQKIISDEYMSRKDKKYITQEK